MDDLSRRILEFEKRWWRQPGAKLVAIAEEFEITDTRYYQLLNQLLYDPAAALAEPELIARLRRLRRIRVARKVA